MPPARLLRFGPFQFDVRAGDLQKDGVRIHLQEQIAQILLILLEHPFQVVLRSEIRQQLWPGDTVVDFDQSINAAVKRLRNALGESAGAPQYIETISKKGYRFIAEVKLEAPAEPEAPIESRYRLLDKLGEGGVGVVYRAEDVKLGRQVAVKFLRGTDGELPEPALLRLEQEARAASSLNHPHICTIHGLEDFDGRPGIVMELVGGETLAECLARGPLPLREALRIALQTASALAEAHTARVVHRDLKPANLMLTKNGVKVLDFGLTSTQSGSPSPNARPGGIHASPQYLSPEQREGGSVDARSDIFSLGVMLFEMLTGRPAQEGAGAEQLSEVPRAVAQFLARCLARDPQARWQSAAEAQAELERIAREELEPAAPPERRNIWPRAGVAVAVALAIATGVYLQSGRRSQGPPLRAVSFTSFPGEQNFPAISPDGEKVAFSWVGPPREDGRPAMNIYVKSILSGETVPVTSGPTYDRYPQWSPDGSQIAFHRTITLTSLALMIVPSGGGEARKIADAGEGLAWSPDGKEIAYVDRPPKSPGGIVVRSLQTGAIRQVTSPPGLWERFVAWSPDGKQIAFSRQMPNSVRELFVVPSQGGPARQLTFDHQTTGGFAWTADSRELVFDSNRGSRSNLWRIGVSGGSPERVAYTATHPAFPSISMRSHQLAYSDSFTDTNIWQYELTGTASGGALSAGSPKCLICSSVEDDSPRYSPDGRRIVFVSWRSGSEALWTAASDGTGAKQLTFLEGRTGSPRWSPDGRWIAFDSRVGGSPDVYVVSAAGGTPRRLAPEPRWRFEPGWSQDGQWIYFISEKDTVGHIWKAPFAGGAARLVTQGDGGESQESADGKRLYYFNRRQDGIWSVPVDGGPEEVVPELRGVKRTRAWTVRQEGIYFYDDSAGRPEVRFFSFATRRVSTVLSPPLPTPRGNPGLDISPDGRKLLYTQEDRRVDGLMMIENFR